MRNKVTVIGGGNVGATTILYLAEKHLADLVLVDVVKGMPQAKQMDTFQSAALRGYDVDIVGTNDYREMHGSDVVVVTAGLPRKPGMSRSDLLNMNAKIVREVSENIKRYASEAIVIIVSNPLDVMCWVCLETTRFESHRVIGMAGVLDTTRMRYFIAEELGVYPADVMAMVLGGHGDSMVPIHRCTTVSGLPIDRLMPPDQIEAIVERTRKGGGEIVNLLKTGSAFYAPAASAAEMVEAILRNSKRILPCSAFLRGEYGIDDCYIGVPVKLGKWGIEQIYEMDLSPEELAALQSSAKAVREDIELLGDLSKI